MTLRTPLACLTLFIGLALAGCGDPRDPLDVIEAHRGDWVLINYWAEWCKPCIREVPELNRLDGEEGITVLGVNYDGAAGDELAVQLTTLGITFAQLTADPAAPLRMDRPQVLPTTVLINPAGHRIATLVGPQTVESLRKAMATWEAGAGNDR